MRTFNSRRLYRAIAGALLLGALCLCGRPAVAASKANDCGHNDGYGNGSGNGYPDWDDGGGNNGYPVLHSLRLSGQGKANLAVVASDFAGTSCASLANLICLDKESCQCVSATGLTVNGSDGLGQGNLLIAIGTDFSTDLATAGRACFGADGVAVLTSYDNKQTLVLETTGLICNSPSLGLRIYSGGFGVSPSTYGSYQNSGRYAKATGLGEITFTTDVTKGFFNVPAMLHMVGNVSHQ